MAKKPAPSDPGCPHCKAKGKASKGKRHEKRLVAIGVGYYECEVCGLLYVDEDERATDVPSTTDTPTPTVRLTSGLSSAP